MSIETLTQGPARRIRALSSAEMRLLWRNKTAIFTALAMPVGMVLILLPTGIQDDAGGGLGPFVVATLIGFTLLFVVYYNLVTAYVARREELVLKRLRVGEASDREVLLGMATPAIALGTAQVALGIVAAMAFLDLGRPVNPILVLLAVAGGAAVFTLLAAASTPFTRSVELAQVTTLPVAVVGMLFSGLLFPLDALPTAAEQAARLLPLTPVVELTNLGLRGSTGDLAPVGFAASFTEAIVPLAVLAAWIVVGRYGVRRWFRWEPRA
jgi:ABC-2 type transport system permease protein